MTGVTIIDTIVLVSHAGAWGFWPIFWIVVGAILVIGCFWLMFYEREPFMIFVAGLIAILSTLSALISYDSNGPEVTEYQYQVIVDDSVSMTEFTDKYEIIEVKGESYIVKEIEAEEKD